MPACVALFDGGRDLPKACRADFRPQKAGCQLQLQNVLGWVRVVHGEDTFQLMFCVCGSQLFAAILASTRCTLDVRTHDGSLCCVAQT